MNNNTVKTNRDIQRTNNANKAVQGCLYSNINTNCIDKLLANEKNKNTEEKMSSTQIVDILKVAKDSNIASKRLFMQSQNSVSKTNCTNYAAIQFRQLSRMVENGEDTDSVKSISKSVVDKHMIDMTKKVILFNQSGKNQNIFHLIYSSFWF